MIFRTLSTIPLRKLTKLDELALSRGYYFDLKAAERVKHFFEKYLIHCKGRYAGKSFKFLEWQWEDLIKPLFGWKKPDGNRRFKKAFVEIPKKNGKSAISSGIALFLLTADNEYGAEIYSIAGEKEQAAIVFNESLNMVTVSEVLSERIDIVPSMKRLNFPEKKSFYRVLSSEASTKEGYNVHGLIWDEYHVQTNEDLKTVLEFSGAAREQPIQIIITTAGEDTLGPWYKEELYAKQVEAGEIEDLTYFSLIYKAEETDNWEDEKVWFKANPSLSDSKDGTLTLEEMRESYIKAKSDPVMEIAFRRYRLNQLVNAATKWLDLNDWDACKDEEWFDPVPGSDCFAAIDLATTTDLNSLTLYFPEYKKFMYYYWCPEEQVEMRYKTQKYKYNTFVQQKLLTLVPGKTMDYDYIHKKLDDIQHTYNLKKIACDPYNATDLCTRLQKDGFEIMFFRQNYTNLSSPAKMFQKGILEHKFRHDGNLITKWCIKNVRIVQDNYDNIRPDKERSVDKIDGVVTSIMAYALSLQYEEEHDFPYDTRGIAAL